MENKGNLQKKSSVDNMMLTDKDVNNNKQKGSLYAEKVIPSTLSKYSECLLCVPGNVLGSENTIKMSKVTQFVPSQFQSQAKL